MPADVPPEIVLAFLDEAREQIALRVSRAG
jgi:hypothetical protein